MKPNQMLIVIILFTAFPLVSSAQAKKFHFTKADSLFVFNPKLSPEIKRKMLDSSFGNHSTAPNFIVIIANNQITGETREVCTEAPFVVGGVDRNTGKEKFQEFEVQYFYFNTKSALENIGFNEYSYWDLLVYGQNKAIKQLVNTILNSNENLEINFRGTRKEQFMLAHILFNNGILSTRGCIAGNLMTAKKVR